MKKIIDGKTYNTETAEQIGRYYNNLGSGDFGDLDEELYITKKNNFFLVGEGGAMTKWAESNGNNKWGASGMIEMDKDQALRWCEDHDIDADIITKYFTIEDA